MGKVNVQVREIEVELNSDCVEDSNNEVVIGNLKCFKCLVG